MSKIDALLAIQELMDGTEWNSDTLEAIAQVMINAGYRIRDLDDVDLKVEPWCPPSIWEDHPLWHASDWVSEVENNDTRLGYIDWVNQKIEQARAAAEDTVLTVTCAERDTILAALRYYQENGQGDPLSRSDAIHEIATNGGMSISLNAEAIDELCERINQ